MPNPYYTKPSINFSDFQRTSPIWAGTPQHQPKVLLPGGGHLNAAEFVASSDAVMVTVGTGGATAGATTVPVAALAKPIPNGTILDFTAPGSFAKLTAAAAAGATSLTVEALPQALTAGDIAYYSPLTRRFVQSGTLVGRTYAERDAGIGYGPADVTTPDDQIYLLYFDVVDCLTDNEAELYMPRAGNVVYENLLPGWAALPTAVKTFIRQNYVCETGVA